MTDTTQDEFLDGRLVIRQPIKGYRAGADPVFLAAAVPAKSGESVLELGCGVGVALYCLMRRVSGLSATGVEFQHELAHLARENGEANGLKAEIVTANLMALPEPIKAVSYDHVFANPPYFDRRTGSESAEIGRELGRGEETPLTDWVDVAVRRLKPKGRLTLIQRTSRLSDVLATLDDRVGDVSVQPLVARKNHDSEHFILSARKGAKGAFRLQYPLVLHDGAKHIADGDSYSPAAKSVLRDSESLSDAILALK
ncbi:MAG: methyltransferase [Boseongicola sp.]|nr:MAG: methyltransferase [Boseongicola sp.]